MKKAALETVATHTIMPSLLSANSVVLDIGANVGEFSSAMAACFGCSCLAVEASSKYYDRIPVRREIKKFNYAITGKSGFIYLNIPICENDFPTIQQLAGVDYGSAVRVQARSLEAFCSETSISRIDVLKMDIEGAELEVFSSCSDRFLANINQITVEFHEWAGVGTVDDVRNVMKRMRKLGFRVFNVARTSYLDVLFVHKRLLPMATFNIVLAKFWGPRVALGIMRRLGVRRKSPGILV